MAKRYIDVYEDTDQMGSTGVRDDGAVDVLHLRGLDDWRRWLPKLDWEPADSSTAATWRADCRALIGRVEYDDGLPDVACEPST